MALQQIHNSSSGQNGILPIVEHISLAMSCSGLKSLKSAYHSKRIGKEDEHYFQKLLNLAFDSTIVKQLLFPFLEVCDLLSFSGLISLYPHKMYCHRYHLQGLVLE